MDNKDKNFFIALAYTAIHEKGLDLPAFRQKIQDNLDFLNDIDSKKPYPKTAVHKSPY